MANGPWCGKWALVTGASSGIGAALAEELAAGGTHLVLIARRARRLATLSTKLRAAHGVRVKVLAADLAQPKTPAGIFAFTQERGITVDLLVNNAGVGSYGEFRASDLEREIGIIRVNCSALVQLTHLYLPGMVERHSGAILIVSSTAAYQGVPYMATYAASKGFGLLFAEALAREVGGRTSGVPQTQVLEQKEVTSRYAISCCSPPAPTWQGIGPLFIWTLSGF